MLLHRGVPPVSLIVVNEGTSLSKSTTMSPHTETSFAYLAPNRAIGMLRGMALKVVIFDFYEALTTQFDPDWKPPNISVTEWLGVEEAAFGRR